MPVLAGPIRLLLQASGRAEAAMNELMIFPGSLDFVASRDQDDRWETAPAATGPRSAVRSVVSLEMTNEECSTNEQ